MRALPLSCVALLAACVATVDESGRPCPCSGGWRCCAAEGVCVREAEVCKPPFPPNPRFDALGDGEAMDLGPFRCEPLAGEGTDDCKAITDDAALRYDRRHHRFYLLGHGNTANDALYAFDPQTLVWTAVYAPTPCASMAAVNYDADAGAWLSGPGAGWPRPLGTSAKDLLVPVPERDELVLLQRGPRFADACSPVASRGDERVAHFDIDAGAWSFSDALIDGMPDYPGALEAWEWDPPSQQLVGVGQAGLYVYDPATRTKRRVVADLSAQDLGFGNELVFDGASQTHYYFERQRRRLFMLALDRAQPFQSSLAEVAFTGAYPTHDEPGFAWDERNGIIGGAVLDGAFTAFDPATGAFTTRVMRGADGGPAGAGTMQGHCIAYDPVDAVFVFVTTLASGFRTWAYRHRR